MHRFLVSQAHLFAYYSLNYWTAICFANILFRFTSYLVTFHGFVCSVSLIHRLRLNLILQNLIIHRFSPNWIQWVVYALIPGSDKLGFDANRKVILIRNWWFVGCRIIEKPCQMFVVRLYSAFHFPHFAKMPFSTVRNLQWNRIEQYKTIAINVCLLCSFRSIVPWISCYGDYVKKKKLLQILCCFAVHFSLFQAILKVNLILSCG